MSLFDDITDDELLDPSKGLKRIDPAMLEKLKKKFPDQFNRISKWLDNELKEINSTPEQKADPETEK
jgi:hypothetical protein